MRKIISTLIIVICLINPSYAIVDSTNATQFEQKLEIGLGVDDLSDILSTADRVDSSIYNFDWFVYINEYKNYFKLGISDNTIVSIFSKSPSFEILDGIKVGNKLQDVSSKYGPGETYYGRQYVRKYSFDQYDLLLFIDNIDEDKISSWMMFDRSIDYDMVFQSNIEDSIKTKDFESIKTSYTNQILDLVNVQRVLNDLNPLKLSEFASNSAEQHSKDMAQNNFFDHINQKGQSPFDRMKANKVRYRSAGENIAYGYENPVFVHEAWMNSPGHRHNVMDEYDYIGIGIAIKDGYSIYYTQNFYK